MKVILKEPGFPAYLADIPNELKDLQEYVGGRIDGLAPNCTVCGVDFVGPVIMCSPKGDKFSDIRTPGKVMPLIHEASATSPIWGMIFGSGGKGAAE